MREVIFITGGQRSGKSSFAQKMAEQMSDNPLYLATARHWDEEFTKRIERHQADRGEKWSNVECEKELSRVAGLEGRVVLLDCITLWLTNIFTDNSYELQKSLDEAKEQWRQFVDQDFRLIIVSNEIGMGVIPMDKTTRAFVDLQGWMNQYIASSADIVYNMVSGIAVKIK